MSHKDKELAFKLREQGYSYAEISQESGYSVDWCKKNLKDTYKGLVNDIKYLFAEDWYMKESNQWPLYIDDIVSGIARLDWYGERGQQIPLSTVKIISCFLWLDVINAQNISILTGLGKKHSEKYERACRLAYPFLKRSIEGPHRFRRYPSQSIVCYENGIAEGYDKSQRSRKNK